MMPSLGLQLCANSEAQVAKLTRERLAPPAPDRASAFSSIQIQYCESGAAVWKPPPLGRKAFFVQLDHFLLLLGRRRDFEVAAKMAVNLSREIRLLTHEIRPR